jgi:hypothetical protein
MVPRVSDDPGVMGNLPRSRPGRRSEKRAGGAKGPAKSTTSKSSGPKATSKRSAAKAPRARPSAERAPRTSVREERVEAPQGHDPITAALRVGMTIGDAGLKAVAKLVERLPRP